MKLSICIPTYNRHKHLNNCLNSILIAKKNFSHLSFEVCMSDNSNDFQSKKIIQKYNLKLKISYKKNKKNVGYIKNYLNTIKMAKGEFVWVIGDDEILKYNALQILYKKFYKHKDVDFIFLNSNTLHSDYLKNFKQPFNTFNLPKKMESFSKAYKDKKTSFFNLIDYKVSWDFLLGIFQCIYKKKMFLENLKVVNHKKLFKPGVWSTFENTAFYTQVYAAAFKDSKVLIQAKPIVVSLYGHKSWEDLWDFIKIVRIPELLDMYKKKGLDNSKYLKMKNFALRDFFSCFKNIYFKGDKAGLKYVKIYNHIFLNIFFPSIYINLLKKILFKFNKIFLTRSSSHIST